MKVLFCVDSLALGGKERQAVELVKGLTQRADVELLVVCMDRGAFYQLQTRLQYATRRCRWDPFVFWAVNRIVREFRPDVVHTDGLISSFYALPVAKCYRIPVVNGSIRNAFGRPHRRWRLERALLAWSDIRVANSEAGLRSRRLSSSSGRDFVIYNGIDLTRVCPDSNDLMPHRKTVVGMVARFDTNKDHVTFISAALRLLAEGRDITFLVVGDGETLNTTKRLVPVDCAAIQFLGRRNDVDRLLSSFSIGVLSTFTEGISNAIMEYMARGKPVVASDVGGCREIVLDGVTGFLVPPRNPTALADRIAYLIDCPEVARRMGQAGRKRIVTHFSLETMVEKTVALYVRALRSSSRRTDDAAECCNATRRHERPF